DVNDRIMIDHRIERGLIPFLRLCDRHHLNTPLSLLKVSIGEILAEEIEHEKSPSIVIPIITSLKNSSYLQRNQFDELIQDLILNTEIFNKDFCQ
ncbi:unnamed protein product, partial [Didymodactylos carnosus]